MQHRWAKAGVEPSLTDVLSDPIVHQVMRRDRLSLDAVCFAIRTAQDALRRRLGDAADEKVLTDAGCAAA